MIDDEYARWQMVNNISYNLEQLTPAPKKKYEILNIFERYLLNSANLARIDVDNHNDAIFVNVPITHYIYSNMIREIVDKKIAYHAHAKKMVQTVVKARVDTYIENMREASAEHPDCSISHTRGNGECCYRYKKFNATLSYERSDALHAIAEHNGISNSGDRDYYILVMLIRYSCLLQRGQQWNLPRAWYKAMYNKYGSFIELFASPLNSQSLLERSNDHLDFSNENSIRYGSLFPDTDAIFGSIGSAFDLKVDDVEGQVVIANPPYVLEVMDRVGDMIQRWLSEVDTTVILNVPDWTDADYHKESMISPYLVFECCMEANEYYYENSLEVPVKRIVAVFPSHLFVFTSGSEHSEHDLLDGYTL